jgi:hypothetical protein
MPLDVIADAHRLFFEVVLDVLAVLEGSDDPPERVAAHVDRAHHPGSSARGLGVERGSQKGRT